MLIPPDIERRIRKFCAGPPHGEPKQVLALFKIVGEAIAAENHECAKICCAAHYDNYQLYRKSRHSYDEGRCDEAANLQQAIEARGKE